MTCADFLDRFSDYYDGLVQPAEAVRFDDHRAECPSCARYARVLDQSLGLLRELPTLAPHDGFHAGIHYRIQHEDEVALVGLGPLGSAAATRTIALVAVVLAFSAWAPSLANRGSDTLAPAEFATAAQRDGSDAEFDEIKIGPFSAGQLSAPDDDVKQLWIYPNAMLYEYSALGRDRGRAQEAAFIRAVGLE